MSETLKPAALPRSSRSGVVLAVSLTLNVAALVLALIALPRKDHLVAERFEIVDTDDASAGWFASTPEGAELVFRQGLRGGLARFVVDAKGARFETVDETGAVMSAVNAFLDGAALEVIDGDARVQLAVGADGGRVTISDPEGSITLNSGSDVKSIELVGGASDGLPERKVWLAVDRARSIIRVASGEDFAEMGSEADRSWIATNDQSSRAKVDIQAGAEGASILLRKLEMSVPPREPGEKDFVIPARSLLLAVGPDKAGIRMDSAERTLRWPDPETAP